MLLRCTGLDTVAGVGLPGEASGYSDVSGLRTEQSAMSTRGYVGYVTGGLGDTVLEESDMREILAGGKSRMEGGDQDGEEKQGMEPVLQELKCVFFVFVFVALCCGCTVDPLIFGECLILYHCLDPQQ